MVGKVNAHGDAPESSLRADIFLGLVTQVAKRGTVIRNVGEGVLALGVGAADTEESGGEFENVGRVVHRGHEAGLAAAVVHVDAERLQVAADDVCAVAAGTATTPREMGSTPTTHCAPASCAAFAISRAFTSNAPK